MHLSQWSRRTCATALSAAFLVGIGLVATTQEASARRHHRTRHHVSHNDLASVAGRTSELKTTMEAYKKAGMVGVLRAAGPYTVFMPSDAGWGKMPKDSREGLMNDPKKLKEILKYHMVKGRHDAADLGAKRSITTVQGESLMLDNKDGTVIVDGCITTTPDVKASNGLIQIIDYIPIPERGK